MKMPIAANDKKLWGLYLGAMAALLIAIEIAQLALSDRVTGLLKTFPAVMTALMGIRQIRLHGVSASRDRYLGAAVIILGIADILLCFFVAAIPLLSKTPGFIAFSVTQLLLMLWLGLDRKSICLHAATVAIMIAIGILAGKKDAESMSALVNLGLLLGNLIRGAALYRRKKTLTSKLYLYAAVGIAVCDYSILARTVIGNTLLRSIATEIAWIGYIPFLVLLLMTLCSVGKNSGN